MEDDPDSLPDDPTFALLARHDDELAKLSERVNALGGSSAGDDPAKWAWAALAGEARTAAVEELIDWVGWLIWRYRLSELPACWWRHGAMVEELIALHAFHAGAYSAKAKHQEPLAWHEALGRWRTRMHDWDIRGCGGAAECHDRPETARKQTPWAIQALAYLASDDEGGPQALKAKPSDVVTPAS